MKVIPNKKLTFNSTNISDDGTLQWDMEAGYAKGTIRQLNNKLYETYGAIYPLATYIYDNTDVQIDPYATGFISFDYIKRDTSIVQKLYDGDILNYNSRFYTIHLEDPTYYTLSSEIGINLGALKGNIYDSDDNIVSNNYPVSSRYFGTDLFNGKYKLRTPSGAICTLNDTIVYNTNDNKYYVFDNSSGTTDNNDGTYSVDFTQQDPETPANFTEVTGYRNTIDNPSESPLIWKDLGYTNKYKMLDDSLTSQTVVSGNMEMSFITNKIDSIYLFRIFGTSVNVTVTQLNDNTEIYNQTTSLSSKNSLATFRGYFFNDFTYVTKIFSEVPINFNVRVDITIFAAPSSDTKCGLVAIGRSQDFGATLYGAKVGMLDFSKKETNTNGESYFVEGNYKPTNSLTIDLPSNRTDYIVEQLQSLRAKPVIWKGSDYSSTIIYGIYNDWSVVISTPTITRISINLESLI